MSEHKHFISFDKPKVLAIVVLPRIRSHRDHILKSFCNLVIFGAKLSVSHNLRLYANDVPKAQMGLYGHLISKGLSVLFAFFPSHIPLLEASSFKPLQSPLLSSNSSGPPSDKFILAESGGVTSPLRYFHFSIADLNSFDIIASSYKSGQYFYC